MNGQRDVNNTSGQKKARSWLGIGCITFLFVGVAISLSSILTTNNQNTPSPTPKPTATVHLYEDGEYFGDNPNVFFEIKEGLLPGGIGFDISFVYKGSEYDCYSFSLGNGLDKSDTSTNTFEYQNISETILVSGQITGKTAGGNYSISSCANYPAISFDPPVEGQWSAAWRMTQTPVILPTPTLPVPPRAGHFVGDDPNVSFDVKGDGSIYNFRISVSGENASCTLSQDGLWGLNSGGTFLAYFGSDTPATTVSGFVEDKSATGSYYIANCGSSKLETYDRLSGDWEATWINP